MRRTYGGFLTAEFLDKRASAAGFRNPLMLENFVMDFEVHGMVRDKLDTCLRGGMAAPFYLEHGTIRLSRDVDLFAFETKKRADEKMQEVVAQQGDLGIRISRAPTNPALGHLPLLQYRVAYESAFGGDNAVKLDIFCDPRLRGVPCETAASGFDLEYFSTRHPMRVLGHAALIADKITSLSAAPVGYGTERRSQMHKQIYDIALLLRRLPDADLPGLIRAYRLLASAKGSFHARQGAPGGLSAGEIAASVPASVLALLDRDKNMALTRDFSNGFSSFKGTYLGGGRYQRMDHHANALLVVLFSKRLSICIAGADSVDSVRRLHRQTIDILSGLQNPAERPDAEDAIRKSIAADDESPGRYRRMSADAAYLLHRIRLEGAA